METTMQSAPKQLLEGRGKWLRIFTWASVLLFVVFAGMLVGAFVLGIEYIGVLLTVIALSGLAFPWVLLTLIFSLVAFILEIRHLKRSGENWLGAFATLSFGVFFLTLGSILWVFFGFLG